MGTQQILLIVLSVIIVGAAVVVGITMFSTAAENANRQSILSDLQSFGSSVMSFYKTPQDIMGGGGSGTPGFGGSAATMRTTLGRYLGFTTDGTFTNDNGTYLLIYSSPTVIRIRGTGTEIGQSGGTNKVQATLTITATAASPLATVIDN